jgi:hypothetical protein
MEAHKFTPGYCKTISKQMGFRSNVFRNIMLHGRPPQEAVLRKLEELIPDLRLKLDLRCLYDEAMYDTRGGFTANQPPRKKQKEEEEFLTLEEEEEEISIEQEDKLVESQKMALIIKLLEGKKLSEVIDVSKSVGMSAEELLPILRQMYE